MVLFLGVWIRDTQEPDASSPRVYCVKALSLVFEKPITYTVAGHPMSTLAGSTTYRMIRSGNGTFRLDRKLVLVMLEGSPLPPP